MKNFAIRAFVVVLALSGAAATAHTRATGRTAVVSASALPIPMCPPNDPNACGLD